MFSSSSCCYVGYIYGFKCHFKRQRTVQTLSQFLKNKAPMQSKVIFEGYSKLIFQVANFINRFGGECTCRKR